MTPTYDKVEIVQKMNKVAGSESVGSFDMYSEPILGVSTEYE